MLITVDTLDFRARFENEHTFLEFVGLDDSVLPLDSWETSGGFRGYAYSLYYCGIRFAWGGEKGFYFYISMSGKGCRTYEDLHPGLDWNEFLGKLRSRPDDYHISRIDIALDEREGYLSIKRLESYIANNKYSTRCGVPEVTKYRKEIVRFGSSQSDIQLRMYNKKLERGYEPDDLDGKPWWRSELQLRDDRATSFIDSWLSSGDLGITYSGVLREFVRFLQKPNRSDGNQHRIPEACWWVELCSDAERIKLATAPGSDYNVQKLKDFCFRTAGSSVYTLIRSQQLTPDELYSSFVDCDSIKLRSDQTAFIDKCLKLREGKLSG